jgi:hypothetical protein
MLGSRLAPFLLVAVVLVACGGAQASGDGGGGSRCDPESGDDAPSACVEMRGAALSQGMSVRSYRFFRSKICMAAYVGTVPYPSNGPNEAWSLELCVGTVDLGPRQSFQIAALGLDDAVPRGSATLVWTHTTGECHASTAGGYGSGKPICTTLTTTKLQPKSGSVECELSPRRLACRLREQRFEDLADAAKTSIASGWIHATPPAPPAACEPRAARCAAEPAGEPSGSCISGEGDVVRVATDTHQDTASQRAKQLCLAGSITGLCALDDDHNRKEDHLFYLCLGTTGLTTERSFTVSGEYPHAELPPGDGMAAFVRDEYDEVSQAGSSSVASRHWLAKSGTITCGPSAGYVACRFEKVAFEDREAQKTSTASGWIHAQ